MNFNDYRSTSALMRDYTHGPQTFQEGDRIARVNAPTEYWIIEKIVLMDVVISQESKPLPFPITYDELNDYWFRVVIVRPKKKRGLDL